MKKILLAAIVLTLAFAMAAPAKAAVFFNGENVMLGSSGPVIDDAYAAGGTMISPVEINGDLVAVGGNLQITGKVDQDLLAAGGMIDVFGEVGDDARIAGGMVTINGTIDDDLVVFGGMVRLLPSAVVKGDVLVYGGSVIIDGKVEGAVKAGAGNLMLNGQVIGPVMAEVDELQIGPAADIAGGLKYTAVKQADVPSTAKISGIDFTERKFQEPQEISFKASAPEISPGAILAWSLLKLIGKILGALALVFVFWYFLRSHLYAIVRLSNDRFASMLGWGLVWLIIAPIAGILVLVTLIGGPVAAVIFAFYTLTLTICKPLAGLLFGAWLWKWRTKQWPSGFDYRHILLGVTVFYLLAAIPLLGWIFGAVLSLSALGATVVYVKNSVAK